MIINLILYILASVLAPFVNLLGLIVGTIIIASSKKFKGRRKDEFSKYYHGQALSKDQHANVANKYFFGLILTKTRHATNEEVVGEDQVIIDPTPFGDPDQTISYVLGKNKQLGTLNLHGKFWCFLLNLIDKGHVEKAVINEEER